MTDNISFNTTSTHKASVRKPDTPRPSRVGANKHNANNGFDFDVAKPKIKAIAVRRRALPAPAPTNGDVATALPAKVKAVLAAVATTLQAKNTVSSITLNKASSAGMSDKATGPKTKGKLRTLKSSQTGLATQAPLSTNAQVKDKPTPAASLSTMLPPVKLDGDLMLNVITAPVTTTAAAKPKQQSRLARAERLQHKRQERRGQAPVRVFSKTEIDEALKRRQVNPNQRPTAGDLFKAQLDKEREQMRLAEGAQVPAAAAATETNEAGNARAMNRFRTERPYTKKVGLFDQSDVAAMQQLGQRAVKPVVETIFSDSNVSSLNLHAHAVKNLQDLLGITKLTTVQLKTIPQVLAGKDVLVRSQTGSGKTLAYALPIVEQLQAITPKINRSDGIMALIIVPTRELAVQTYELIQKLVKPYTWIVPGALLGGESRKSEKARLRKGINVLIGTPGRIVDHLLHTISFRLGTLQFFVLDEADRLLEMGYERNVQHVVDAVKKHRAELVADTEKQLPKLQSLLLSATLTAEVQKMAGLALHEPLYIDNSDMAADAAIISTQGYNKDSIEAQIDTLGEYEEDATGVLSIPDNLQLSYMVVPPKLRLVAFSALLAKELSAAPKQFKAVIFMSTIQMVDFHHDMLTESLTRRVLDEDDEDNGNHVDADDFYDVEEDDEDDAAVTVGRAGKKKRQKPELPKKQQKNPVAKPLLEGMRFYKLHGSMTQADRQGVFNSFRECSTGVLLATDVVGRGIDVPDIKLVVQYSPPQKTADFVHRVGRTARAGRRGRALLFLAPTEAKFVRHLEDKRIRIQQADMYDYLQALVLADAEARNVQEAASNLQHKFQTLIEDDKELHDKACSAFVSWMKFYTTFPKELKPIFNAKSAHMGHFAKSFGLKEAPTKVAKQHAQPKPQPATNRLTYTERDPEKLIQEKKNKRRFTTTVTGEVRNLQSTDSQQRDHKPGARNTAASGGGTKSSFMKSLNKSRAFNISEFDSGLPAVKQRKLN